MPAVDRYFFARYPSWPIAAHRIYLGLLFVIFYLQIRPDFYTLFSLNGLGGWRPGWFPGEPWAYSLLNGACVLAASFVVLGLFTRTSLVFLFLLHVLIVRMNVSAFWSWSHMSGHFLIFLILADAGKTLSLDVRLRLRSREQEAPAWNFHLFQWQLMFIYAIVVLWRVPTSEWWSGDVLEATLRDNFYSRFSHIDLSSWSPLLKALSIFGFGLEVLGATLAFWPFRARRWLVIGLIGFHSVTLLTTTVQIWQQVMIGALCLGLVSPRGGDLYSRRPKFLPWFMVGYFALALFAALPNFLLSSRVDAVRQLIQESLVRLRIGATSSMRLFDKIPEQGRHCFIVVGHTANGSTQVLYENTEYCSASRFRFSEDEVYMTMWRMMIRHEGSRSRLGRYFCYKAGLDVDEVTFVHRSEHPISPIGGFLAPGTQNLYTCKCASTFCTPTPD